MEKQYELIREIEQVDVTGLTSPAIFYLMDKKDPYNLFFTFAIIDNLSITYFHSCNNNNLSNFENSNQYMKLIGLGKCFPHSAVPIGKKKICVFNYGSECNYFFILDIENLSMKLLTADLFPTKGSVVGLCDTFYNDAGRLILCAKTLSNDQYYFEYFETDGKFEKYRPIYLVKTTKHRMAPHMTKMHKNKIYSVEFRPAELLYKGKDYESTEHMLTSLAIQQYRRMSKSKKAVIHLKILIHYLKISVGKFWKYFKYGARQNSNIRRILSRTLSVPYPDIASQLSTQINFREVCVKPGRIRVYDLENKKEDIFTSSSSNPGHIEFDDDTLFLSNHNVDVVRGKITYFGIGVIDKFVINGKKHILNKTFSCPDGYRYTTHKLFSYGNNKLIATFAEPNRLILIDAETMILFRKIDIGKNVLSNNKDIMSFINNNDLHNMVLATMQVLENYKLLLISNNFLYTYDIANDKLTHIPYKIHDKNLILMTSHSQYLKEPFSL